MQISDYYRIEKAINYLDQNFEQQPGLEELASHVGLSPSHFQKLFTKWAGISPKRFLQLLTLEQTKLSLSNSAGILQTINTAGLSSTSRLHELFVNIEAVTPSVFRNRGKGLIIKYGFQDTPFGDALIGISDLGIIHLAFVDERIIAMAELTQKWPYADLVENHEESAMLIEQIFSSQTPTNKIKLAITGTNFQLQVWKALLSIPEGKLVTYEDIAQKINNPKAVRAVGTAIGSNPIAYLIPCHRVIKKTGVLGNYRWGSERKKLMFGWEAAHSESEWEGNS